MTRPEGRAARLPLSAIRPDPDQPRKEFDWDNLKNLAASIRANGQWVRIIVRPDPKRPGEFILVDGERRFRAMALVPSTEIDAEIVEEPLDKGQLLMVQTSLGMTSQHLDHLEMGAACKRLMDIYKLEGQELAEKLGVDASTVSRVVSLNGLAEALRADFQSGAINFSVGYQLSRLEGRDDDQIRLAGLVKSGDLTREGLAAAVSKLLGTGKPKSKEKLMKASANGGTVIFPEAWTPARIAELGTRIVETARKLEKHQLPVASFPDLLQKS